MFHFSLKKHYLKVSCYIFVIALLAGLMLSLDSAALSQEVQAAAPVPTATPKPTGTPTPKQTATPKPGSTTPAPAKTPLPGAGSPPVPAGNRIGGAKAPILSAGDGNWFWQYLLPQGFSINSISCPQPANCFAVTDGGTVLLTTDGGTTWVRQFFLDDLYLTDISCSALNNCFVVGSRYDVTNGVYLSRIFHFDGTSWQTQYQATDGSNTPLTDIDCWSVNGCIAGGSIALVYDGTNWNLQSLTHIKDIVCPAARLCFVTTSNPTGGGLIGRYSNGNWSYFDILTVDNRIPELGNLACFSVIHCLTYALYTVPDNNPAGILLKAVSFETSDGGNNWSEHEPPAFPTPQVFSDLIFSCPDTNTCYALTGTRFSSPSQVFVTTDAGNSWNLIRDAIKPSLLTLSCWSSATCLLGGQSGLTFTYDNGNWNELSSGSKTDNLLDISCPGLNRCFAVGDNGRIMSYDGLSWVYKTAPSGLQLRAIDCPSVNICYAANFGGTPSSANILYTTDGGQTWQIQPKVSTSNLESISCPAVDTCFAVGFRGSIVSLKNGVWSAETTNTTAYLLSISCPATNLCFAVGYNDPATDWVILTYNGTSWNTQFPGFNTIPYPRGVSCPATNRCFAVAGVNLLSYDGTAWTVQPWVIPADVYKLDCPAVDTCFMSGSGQVVIYQKGVWTVQITRAGYAISCPAVTTCFATAGAGIIVNGYPVTSRSDNGSGTQPGTLSFGLKNTAINQPIIFDGITILVSGQLPPLPAGKPILGGCSPNGPTVTLEGGGTTTGGLVLSGDNFVAGLNVTGFKGRQLVLQGHGNHLQCMAANR